MVKNKPSAEKKRQMCYGRRRRMIGARITSWIEGRSSCPSRQGR